MLLTLIMHLSGEELPAFRCELKVSGLTPDEKYMFAVAAYTADGRLIGDTVGESTRPILASHPMPVLMTWAYLAQVHVRPYAAPVHVLRHYALLHGLKNLHT